jgi:hypothetical protein
MIMKPNLTKRQKAILTKVFKGKNVPCLIRDIENNNLNFDQIEEACNLLGGEFLMNGIDENFEATSYGIEVEALLDVVNRPRLLAP